MSARSKTPQDKLHRYLQRIQKIVGHNNKNSSQSPISKIKFQKSPIKIKTNNIDNYIKYQLTLKNLNNFVKNYNNKLKSLFFRNLGNQEPQTQRIFRFVAIQKQEKYIKETKPLINRELAAKFVAVALKKLCLSLQKFAFFQIKDKNKKNVQREKIKNKNEQITINQKKKILKQRAINLSQHNKEKIGKQEQLSNEQSNNNFIQKTKSTDKKELFKTLSLQKGKLCLILDKFFCACQFKIKKMAIQKIHNLVRNATYNQHISKLKDYVQQINTLKRQKNFLEQNLSKKINALSIQYQNKKKLHEKEKQMLLNEVQNIKKDKIKQIEELQKQIQNLKNQQKQIQSIKKQQKQLFLSQKKNAKQKQKIMSQKLLKLEKNMQKFNIQNNRAKQVSSKIISIITSKIIKQNFKHFFRMLKENDNKEPSFIYQLKLANLIKCLQKIKEKEKMMKLQSFFKIHIRLSSQIKDSKSINLAMAEQNDHKNNKQFFQKLKKVSNSCQSFQKLNKLFVNQYKDAFKKIDEFSLFKLCLSSLIKTLTNPLKMAFMMMRLSKRKVNLMQIQKHKIMAKNLSQNGKNSQSLSNYKLENQDQQKTVCLNKLAKFFNKLEKKQLFLMIQFFSKLKFNSFTIDKKTNYINPLSQDLIKKQIQEFFGQRQKVKDKAYQMWKKTKQILIHQQSKDQQNQQGSIKSQNRKALSSINFSKSVSIFT